MLHTFALCRTLANSFLAPDGLYYGFRCRMSFVCMGSWGLFQMNIWGTKADYQSYCDDLRIRL